MSNIIRINYDGQSLPEVLKNLRPKVLLEAIPENLELKKSHYDLFKREFPDILIRSVTSGFPASELGVGIAHPSYPHEINKIFELVEEEPSQFSKLLWALGLIPAKVSDDWSFVLDVYFCGLMQACIQFGIRTNTPFWKIDKYVKQILGPNPFKAHDAIGAKGSNFLTWSCLHHLGLKYGPLFKPADALTERKESGQNWYPANHHRPIVDWILDKEQVEELETIVYGSLIQMTTLMLHEKRADLSTMNLIGELCAQFTIGIPALIRRFGYEKSIEWVNKYHKLLPESARTEWYPETIRDLATVEWQHLYVNAEHDGEKGVIAISRESYNYDVDRELNLAIDWLHQEGIRKLIITSDFHYASQLVGADTTEFFPAITDVGIGEKISSDWSKTARRFYYEFDVAIGFLSGKRCMGGMLELFMHCHFLIASSQVKLAMPEVNLPVIPGMEGCHWALRKSDSNLRFHYIQMLLTGAQVSASKSIGYLVDYSGSFEECLQIVAGIIRDGEAKFPRRKLIESALVGLESELETFSWSENEILGSAQRKIAECMLESCSVSLEKALKVQARKSAEFMSDKLFRSGKIGKEFDKYFKN